MNELLNKLRPDFDCFFRINECLSALDVSLAFAHYAMVNTSCTRPQFSSQGDLALVNAYHPVLMRIKERAPGTQKNDTLVVSRGRMVSNSITVSRKTPFVLITGPNMSGKSTLLKEIGIFQIN